MIVEPFSMVSDIDRTEACFGLRNARYYIVFALAVLFLLWSGGWAMNWAFDQWYECKSAGGYYVGATNGNNQWEYCPDLPSGMHAWQVWVWLFISAGMLLLLMAGFLVYDHWRRSFVTQQVGGSTCSCKRASSHLHYSNRHDFLVGLGLVCFLAVVALAYVQSNVQTAVQVSALLSLSYGEIDPYGYALRVIGELSAPYDYLTDFRVIAELATLALVIFAVATIHSIRLKKAHQVTMLCAVLLVPSGVILDWMHGFLVDKALLQLSSRVCQLWPSNCSEILEITKRVEGQFTAAYGFWGPPAQYLILAFSFATVTTLAAACMTTRVVGIWHPTWGSAAPSVQALSEPARLSIEPPSMRPTEIASIRQYSPKVDQKMEAKVEARKPKRPLKEWLNEPLGAKENKDDQA
jgi:hypothetical protein